MHIIAHSFMKQIQLTMDFGHVHRLVHLIIDQRINTFVYERSCLYKIFKCTFHEKSQPSR